MTHLIEILLEATVLIILFNITEKLDKKITFLKKDLGYLEDDIEILFKKSHQPTELTFKKKIKKEEERMNVPDILKAAKEAGKIYSKKPKSTKK